MTSLARLICRVLPAVSASVLPLLSLSAPAEAVLPPVGNDRSRLVMLPEEAQMSALPYVITPERRALLNTIRFAEGT